MRAKLGRKHTGEEPARRPRLSDASTTCHRVIKHRTVTSEATLAYPAARISRAVGNDRPNMRRKDSKAAGAHLLSVRWPREYSEHLQPNTELVTNPDDSMNQDLQEVENRLRASEQWERLEEIFSAIFAREFRRALPLSNG
jgi:hypothetical protein